MQYPALYTAASGSADVNQKRYFRLVFLEYGFLFLASLSFDFSNYLFTNQAVVALILILFSVLCFLIRLAVQPAQKWYHSRALAESVKTLSWRFAMRAEPFVDTPKVSDARQQFLDQIEEHIREYRNWLGASQETAGSQISHGMMQIRSLPLEDRFETYIVNRIHEQRDWYLSKSRFNRRRYAFFGWFSGGIYMFVILTLLAIALGVPDVSVSVEGIWEWLVRPLPSALLLASAILGWIQMKRFSELRASYQLTAQEIQTIADRAKDKKSELAENPDEQEVSNFVNNAELAFSREHTQWKARFKPS